MSVKNCRINADRKEKKDYEVIIVRFDLIAGRGNITCYGTCYFLID